jgi:hypothetical protein
METTHENTLCSYLYLKLAKHHVLFCFLSFIFYKIGEQEGGTVSARRLALVEGKGGWEMGRRMKKVQIIYTYACKCQNDTCENCSWN